MYLFKNREWVGGENWWWGWGEGILCVWRGVRKTWEGKPGWGFNSFELSFMIPLTELHSSYLVFLSTRPQHNFSFLLFLDAVLYLMSNMRSQTDLIICDLSWSETISLWNSQTVISVFRIIIFDRKTLRRKQTWLHLVSFVFILLNIVWDFFRIKNLSYKLF